MSTVLAQTGLEYYQLFVNALSFTLAVTSVDRYVTSDPSELTILVCTLAMVATFMVVLENQLKQAFRSIRSTRTARMLMGPVGLVSYLLSTLTRVIVHFLSTTVGRWVMTLAPSNLEFWDTVTGVVISISLVWFVGISVGLLNLPISDATKLE